MAAFLTVRAQQFKPKKNQMCRLDLASIKVGGAKV